MANLPPMAKQDEREKGFIQDGVAVSTLTWVDTNPRYWRGIPPYNSQKDPHVANYFLAPPVQKVLQRTDQANGGTSILGPKVDRSHLYGREQVYMDLRKASLGGHVHIKGPGQVISERLPMIGYNGPDGYRRNTPALRRDVPPRRTNLG
ncbi:hypothetical protein GDO86_013678 [Hymenochirus boettgeri]|uniref:Uncharacterized protein n=1 Tax=Hymenochirus boettgeri TaxID=247094 RepID=A0A8T2IXL3_9PIPI|nr:hypothetical protein GDO86_013678 [Hymenochirus boettgeri]